MAVYDLEEQENIEALKAWWQQYGRLVIAVVVAFVLGVAGIQGWRYHKEQQALKAAALFADLEEAVRLGDAKKSLDLAKSLATDYARTAYGARGGIVAAKVLFEKADLKGAEDLLRAAVEAAQDEPIRALASLRLSAVLLDQKKYDDAIKAVSSPPSEAFAALFADARGDVLVAQNKVDEAKAAYQVALDKLPKSAAYRNVVEVKRDALGAR